MHKFIDRIEERKTLKEISLSNKVEKVLIWGESGIGKSELVKKVYSISESLYIDKNGENYFFNIVLKTIEMGFQDYLLNIKDCNYKDLFYNTYGNLMPSNHNLAKFILNSGIYIGQHEIDIEENLAKYIIEKSLINYIIFEDVQVCTLTDRNRMSKLVNYICVLSNRKIKIIYTLSESQGNVYNYFISACDRVLELHGLKNRFIESFLQNYFNDDLLPCDNLANYLLDTYGGNPGKILSLLKQKMPFCNNLDQNVILERLLLPELYAGDPTEERVLLILAVLPFPISKTKMISYLILDPDYPNIDNQEMCNIKIENLISKELIFDHDGFLEMKTSAKGLFRERAMTYIHSVHLIYILQRKFSKTFSDTENSDCLFFLINSGQITIEDDIRKKFFRYTVKAAQAFAKNEMWEKSIGYYERLFPYLDLFNEEILCSMLKALYYGAGYSKAVKFIAQIDDKDFYSYDYWYWKANIYYMVNNSLSVAFFDKAIGFAKNADDILQAEIMRNEAISELPEYCKHTMEYYCALLDKYKDSSFRSVPLLYRNSLVMGGEKTVELCNKGIAIAQKYGMYEEILKLKHNQQFEMFRMGRYENCFNTFEQVSLFFQKNEKRLYESAYGFNNLALLELVNGNFENARLYATSAVIYASTPYSQIATNVNYNLIQSFCENNIDALEKRISKIENLFEEYNIQDNRMYRKTYFSIAISCIREGHTEKAKIYLRKAEPHLQEGRHINRYNNLCKILSITPKVTTENCIQKEDGYYNFYANPHWELWLLAFGHI